MLPSVPTHDPASDLRVRVDRERQTAQLLKDYLLEHGQVLEVECGDSAFAWSTAHHEADRAVLTFSGELDVAVAQRFRQALIDLAEAGAVHLDVDLADVTFLDSHGLSVLLHARKRVIRQGGSLRVIALSPQVRRVLETTGTSALLLVSD